MAQLADTAWKLERLSRVENGRIRARLEEELEKTDEFKTYDLTRRALAVSAFVEFVDASPPPKDAEQTDAFLTGVEKTVTVLREVPGLPMVVVEPLAFALNTCPGELKDGAHPPGRLPRPGKRGPGVKGALSAKLAEDEGALAPVRERLAAEVLLLEDADLRKLERHRKLLETAMQRQLGLLDQLRAQVATVKAENPAEAKELRVTPAAREVTPSGSF